MCRLPCLGKRALIFLLHVSFTCNYVVSVRGIFLFPLVLWIDCVFIVAFPVPSIFFVILFQVVFAQKWCVYFLESYRGGAHNEHQHHISYGEVTKISVEFSSNM